MNRRPALCFCLVMLLACGAAAATGQATRVLRDGQVHAEPADGEDAMVNDGPGGQPTTLRLPTGVTYHLIDASDASAIEVTGGRVTGDIWAYGQARFVARGGVLGRHLVLREEASADIDGAGLVDLTTLDLRDTAKAVLRNVAMRPDCIVSGQPGATLTLTNVTCLDTLWVGLSCPVTFDRCTIRSLGKNADLDLSKGRGAVRFTACTIDKPTARLMARDAVASNSTLKLAGLHLYGTVLLDRCRTDLDVLEFATGGGVTVAGGSLTAREVRGAPDAPAVVVAGTDWHVGRVNLSSGILELPARGGAEIMALADGDAIVYTRSAGDGSPRVVRLAGGGTLMLADGQTRTFVSPADARKLVPIPAAFTPPAPGGAAALRGFLVQALLAPAVVLAFLLARRNWRRALGPLAVASLIATMAFASLWQRSLRANDYWLGHRGDLVQLCRSTGGAIVWWSSHHAVIASQSAWHYSHAPRHPSDPTLSRLPRPHWPTAVQDAVIIPYWLLAALAAIPFGLRATALARRSLRRRRAPRTACPNCGYDLRSSSGRCPECGAVIAAVAS